MTEDHDYVSLRGPVERVGGRLVLQIPLDVGGWELIEVSRGISKIVADDLVVEIPDWFARELGIYEGVYLFVDNRDGKFNMTVDKEVPN